MGKLIEKIKKRLYEWSKPDIEPLKLEVTHTELKHYATCRRISRFELDDSFIPQDVVEREVFRDLVSNIEPAIKDNIVTELDPYSGNITYRVDIWLKS